MSCEDFPCCGHEPGCCPPVDENGNQTAMICICGAQVPLTSKYSLCKSCLGGPDSEGYVDDEWDDEEDFEDFNSNPHEYQYDYDYEN